MEYNSSFKTETKGMIESRITNISPPYILNLNGDLGAGKTFVSRCIARKHGFDDLVSSSFSKMCVLENSMNKIIHVDYFNVQESESFSLKIFMKILIIIQYYSKRNNTFIDIDIRQLSLDISNFTLKTKN